MGIVLLTLHLTPPRANRCRFARGSYLNFKQLLKQFPSHADQLQQSCAREVELDGGVFHFLDLPREIRDKVYGYLLDGECVEQRAPNPNYNPSPKGSELVWDWNAKYNSSLLDD